MNIQEKERVKWNNFTQNEVQKGALVNTVMNHGV
jgi:hypothetical protein